MDSPDGFLTEGWQRKINPRLLEGRSYTFFILGQRRLRRGWWAGEESGGLYDKWIIHFLPLLPLARRLLLPEPGWSFSASYRNDEDDNEDVAIQFELQQQQQRVELEMRKAVFGMLVPRQGRVERWCCCCEAGAIFHLFKREGGRSRKEQSKNAVDQMLPQPLLLSRLQPSRG